MTKLAEIQEAIRRLPPEEQAELWDWLSVNATNETPEVLAAIDEGVRSLEQKGAKPISRTELEARVRRWSGESH